MDEALAILEMRQYARAFVRKPKEGPDAELLYEVAAELKRLADEGG